MCVVRGIALAVGILAAATVPGALADSAPTGFDISRYADPDSVVLAVRADFAPPGGAVRLSVFDEMDFLRQPAARAEALVGEDGVAVVPLELQPGAYAFVAYYDENGDGQLNRGLVGRPKEPYIFSNGVKPKTRKPRFEETKVDVAPGEVVVLTLED
jgi:uncharacterized protein (DUF2141 family)